MTKQNKTKEATMFAKSKVDELFNLVKTQDGIVICCGKFKVSTRKFKTYKQADEYIAQKPYEILINVSVLMVKLNQDEKETNANQPQNSENK